MALLVALILLASSGCAAIFSDDSKKDQGLDGATIDRTDAVTSGGSGKAVLSLHVRYAYADACKFGLTLTNHLPHKITNISFRFAAYVKGDASDPHVTRNFFEIDPTRSQYREIAFPGIPCSGIRQIEITDPGRCALGESSRFLSQPGDCIAQVFIAESPYVKLVRK